jgi:hypothetical protein
MATYWLTSIKAENNEKTITRINTLIGEHKIFATRHQLAKDDWICLYAAKMGIVGYARIATIPEMKRDPVLFQTQKELWAFQLQDITLFVQSPVIPNEKIRGSLDAYKGRKTGGNWGWFFQATRKISEHDFKILTKQSG